MNKKGFAISIVLYAIVFLIITIFYVLLGVIKSRYNTNNDLRNSVVDELNSEEHIRDNLENNSLLDDMIS